MPIRDFKELEIRRSILNKVDPKITSKGDHWKGTIYHKEKLVGKVKIPNHHQKVMKASKSKHIAEALCLDSEQFNKLIECTLSGPEYYKLMDNQL